MLMLFGYIKVDPQCYLFSKCVRLLLFSTLLEINKKLLKE